MYRYQDLRKVTPLEFLAACERAAERLGYLHRPERADNPTTNTTAGHTSEEIAPEK
ncbi:hypothetical protein [Actinopolyspora erythraea]|uniref:hypothetical protein n=1 Tax=Actinopolyspora erythraea TaxID=414996 RepID=UPI0012B656B2|nr:hypothetical protein [Actinopolyspora erythraea]